ncbi:hypothetical protein [Streptomyces humi]|uniref:hypothetical protein n=1 Tax=Streptomyces humi TaxID=1428620 RepID=UPI00062870CA|nr:hypothetical protein [Streptomyces humi]
MRGADGNVRRCTAAADVLAGACVSALRRGGTGGAGATRGPVAGAVTAGVVWGTHATGTAPAAADAGAAVVGVADDGRRTADVGPVTGAVDGLAGVVDALEPFRAAPAGVGIRTTAPPPCAPADGARCTGGAPALTDPAERAAPTERAEPTEPARPDKPPGPDETIEPAEPAEPTEPTEPAEPVQPALPVAPP